jgi:hypothetical protein
VKETTWLASSFFSVESSLNRPKRDLQCFSNAAGRMPAKKSALILAPEIANVESVVIKTNGQRRRTGVYFFDSDKV